MSRSVPEKACASGWWAIRKVGAEIVGADIAVDMALAEMSLRLSLSACAFMAITLIATVVAAAIQCFCTRFPLKTGGARPDRISRAARWRPSLKQ